MSKQLSFSATISALTMALFVLTAAMGDQFPSGSSQNAETPVFSASILPH